MAALIQPVFLHLCDARFKTPNLQSWNT